VKVCRPVRLNMERQIDMSVTGQRHPFKVAYKVGFTKEGRFSALDIQMWSNAGCSMDLSMLIMSMAMLHMGNCYQFSNLKIRGRLCKTHLPSNTGLSQKTLLPKTVEFFVY
jgi:xanthine dehydrogenase molybdopterin-binding subunit B